MKKFEYKSLEIKPQGSTKRKVDLEELDLILAGLGVEGWELITSLDTITTGWTDHFILRSDLNFFNSLSLKVLWNLDFSYFSIHN